MFLVSFAKLPHSKKYCVRGGLKLKYNSKAVSRASAKYLLYRTLIISCLTIKLIVFREIFNNYYKCPCLKTLPNQYQLAIHDFGG